MKQQKRSETPHPPAKNLPDGKYGQTRGVSEKEGVARGKKSTSLLAHNGRVGVFYLVKSGPGLPSEDVTF